MIRPFPLLLTLAAIVAATEAQAQHIIRGGYSQPVATGYVSQATGPQGAMAYPTANPGSTVTGQPARSYSYSYYTRSTLPARTYVGYGTQDFPFHGASYGHPYDPWTWPMMSGSYSKGLARYYDPPVK